MAARPHSADLATIGKMTKSNNVKNARKAMYAAAVKFKGIYQSFAVYELRGATQGLKG